MPRMLVEPQRIRDGVPVGCTGVTMEDGRVFMANRRGHIDVDDTRTARQMVDNPLAPGHVLEQKFGGAGTPGVSCGGCGFGGFRFQRSRPCPRCGQKKWEESQI